MVGPASEVKNTLFHFGNIFTLFNHLTDAGAFAEFVQSFEFRSNLGDFTSKSIYISKGASAETATVPLSLRGRICSGSQMT